MGAEEVYAILGSAVIIGGAIFWLANLQSDVSYLKSVVLEIKDENKELHENLGDISRMLVRVEERVNAMMKGRTWT